MKRMIAGAVTAFLIAAGGVLFTAVPASAHDTAVKGIATCEADGTYSVKWSGTTSNVPDNAPTATATISVVNPAGSVVTPGTITGIARNGTYEFKQTGIPGAASIAEVSVSMKWSDGYEPGPVKGSVKLDGTCKPQVSKTAAADISKTDPTCTASSTASWVGVVNATPEDLSQKQTPGVEYIVKATALSGYAFPDGSTEKTFKYTLSGKLGADKCVASIEIKVTPPTCDASGHADWIKAVNATGGTLSQAVGMQSGEATAVAPALFDNGKTTKSYPYEIKPATGVYQSTDPGKPCFKAPTDAYAKLIVHPSTCTDPGSAEWVDVKFATVSVLDQTPGKDNVGVATALQYHVFRDGTSQQSTSYVVPKATGYQSTDPAAPCFEAPKDAAADLKVTPATCTADGSVSWTVLTNATGDALVQTPGTHTGVATAAANHVFADGSATYSKAYTVAAKTPSQSKDASAPCYVKPPSGLAQTGAADMTLPLSLGAGILAAGVVLTAIGIYRRRNSES